jgi:pyrimidine-nucleoside phosphorylase
METLVELIARKRDGGRLTEDRIARVIRDYMSGELADYQMSALLMAIFFRGMDDAETVALTRAMLHSGDVLDLSSVPGAKVDKHSTGGVGDKVSISLTGSLALTSCSYGILRRYEQGSRRGIRFHVRDLPQALGLR